MDMLVFDLGFIFIDMRQDLAIANLTLGQNNS